jgi:hypothetical protein
MNAQPLQERGGKVVSNGIILTFEHKKCGRGATDFTERLL